MCLRRSEIHKRIQFSLIYIKWNDDWGIKQYGNVFLKIRLYSTDSTKQWPFVLTLVLQIVSSYHKHRVLRDGDCGARHQPGRHEREQPGQGGGEGQRGGQGFWSEENWFPICELRHRYFSATSAWTWLGTQWSLCAVTCSVGRVYIRSDHQLIRWWVTKSSFQWLETRPNRQICPVCKAGISRDKVIPLYGRGNTDRKDPRYIYILEWPSQCWIKCKICQCLRDKVPPRPQGQRAEPTTTNPFSGFGFGGGQGGGGGGFHMSFGIGAFPFTFFASNFNFGEERPGAPPGGSHQATEEAFLHKVFLWVSRSDKARI